ncbi:MAG: cell division protein ZapD [Burkholderiaceae bacterium]|nr:cell division protein ZapD [Burkholderiaceae bacterium]
MSVQSRSIVEVAVGILLKEQSLVLMGKRPSGKPYAGYWEFPGGKLEANESITTALERELYEELGIRVLAHQGSFQQAPSGKVYQLMRITLEDPSLFAEISANKYLVSIRLLKCEQDLKPTLINQDIPFKLTFCQF